MSMFCPSGDECQQDTAVKVLGHTYGNDFINAFFTSGTTASNIKPSSITPEILGGLATMAGILAITLFILLVVQILITSAQDGEAFGKGSTKAVIVSRFLISFALLLPTASNYAIVQIILMTLVLFSNGQTNELYNNIVKISAISHSIPDEPVTSLKTGTDVYGVRGFAVAHLQQAFCVNLLNTNYSSSVNGSAELAYATTPVDFKGIEGLTSISSIYNTTSPNEFRAVGSKEKYYDPNNKKLGSYKALALVSTTGSIAHPSIPICGGLRYSVLPAKASDLVDPDLAKSESGLTSKEQKELYQSIAEVGLMIAKNKQLILMQTTAEISDWMLHAGIPYNLSAPDYESQLSKVNFNDLSNKILSLINKGDLEFTNQVRGLDIHEQVRTLIDSLTAKGWTEAAGIKQRLAVVQSGLSGTLANEPISLSPPQLASLEIEDQRASRFKAALDSLNTITKELMGQPLYSGSNDADLIAQSVPSNFTEGSNGKEINKDLEDRYASLIGTFKKSVVNMILTGEFQAGTPQSALAGNSTQSWFADEYDVLTNIQKTGEWISYFNFQLNSALALSKGVAIGSASALGVSDTLKAIPDGVLNFILHVIEPLLKVLLTSLPILVTYMAVVIPSMPYFFFLTGVIAWYIHIIQAMAGMPFWAVMHMIPERTFVGTQAQGYVTVVALVLRPMLTLAGLFMGFVLSNSILMFTTETFFAMQDVMLESSNSNMLTRIASEVTTFTLWMFVYCTLILQVCYMIFGLAGTLPDTVLRWIGSGLNAGNWGESNAKEALSSGGDSAVRNTAMSGGGGGGNSGGGSGGNTGGGTQNSDNPNTGTPNTGSFGNRDTILSPTGGGVDDRGKSSFSESSSSNISVSTGGGIPQSEASTHFQSLGGQVNADGSAKTFAELKEANKERTSSSQRGFDAQNFGAGAAGFVGGAAQGMVQGGSVAYTSFKATEGGFATKLSAGVRGFVSTAASGAMNGRSEALTRSAQIHFAQSGGVRQSDGSVSVGSGASDKQIAQSYMNLRSATK